MIVPYRKEEGSGVQGKLKDLPHHWLHARDHIDQSQYEGKDYLALTKVVMFNYAIESVSQLTSEKDTLILITADRSHIFAFGGHTLQETSIFCRPRDSVRWCYLRYMGTDINGPQFPRLPKWHKKQLPYNDQWEFNDWAGKMSSPTP